MHQQLIGFGNDPDPPDAIRPGNVLTVPDDPKLVQYTSRVGSAIVDILLRREGVPGCQSPSGARRVHRIRDSLGSMDAAGAPM